MGVQFPPLGVSISVLALALILIIVISGHCTFGIGVEGGHFELGLH